MALGAECVSRHASRLEALSDQDSSHVKCFAAHCGHTFALQEIAAHASPPAFAVLQRHMDDRKEVALQAEFRQWTEDFVANFAAKSEQERRVLAVRQRIEEMMDLRCPKCQGVFGAFQGCAALTCAYAGCKAHFCAFCLADCGGDAHPHVRQCRLNPRPNEYFVHEAVWRRIMDGQRREKLERFWPSLEPAVRASLAADASVRQILSDAGLDRLLQEEAFADQLAQLRGMGFADDQAMRRALGEAGGDVARAVELL